MKVDNRARYIFGLSELVGTVNKGERKDSKMFEYY